MKTTIDLATYESPKCNVLTFDVEGVLCESKVGASHNGYNDGGSIDF